MCGLAGEIRFDKRPASITNVNRMVKAMNRRGPDDKGIYANHKSVFGHARLKIIDLSGRSHQPMHDPQLRLTLVFNGCIYNHRELRGELEGKGYRFFSDGDSEVVLKAYHAWGNRCVEHFNGMFAFVLFENETEKVFMARDRLGIKPLYFHKTPGALRFASTLPALLKSMSSTPGIDPVALHHYMSYHSVIPAPLTLIKDVKKLQPASTITFEPWGTFTQRNYWRPDFRKAAADDFVHDEETLKSAVLEEMRRAVKARMTADVPVGVLLSGGVDSSLIVGLLAEAGHGDLRTFSIGFEDTIQEPGNEFMYSDIVASEFATTHERIVIKRREMLDNLESCIHSMSEPMISHDNIGFYLLGKYVSRHVKVVQSGQGADEIFGGYFWYKDMENSLDPVRDYSNTFFDRDHHEFRLAVNSPYVKDDFSREFVAEHFSQPGADDPVDKALRIDLTVMLVDDPVKRVDNMTMAWGMEARVPFLDHNVVELAARIPPQLKIRNGGKYILKEAARQVIPAAVIDRKKGYFPVPELKYINGEVLDYVRDVLHSSSARQRNIFKPEYLDTLLDEPEAHITNLQCSKLWQIATLEIWLQSHGI